MARMRNRTALRLAAWFCVGLVLFALVTGGVFLLLSQHYVRVVYRGELRERALAAAETYVHLSEMPGGQVPMDATYDPLSRFLAGLSQSDTWVVDAGSRLLTSNATGFEEMPRDEREGLIRRALSGQSGYVEGVVGNVRSLTVAVPIRATDGYVVGAVLLRAPLSSGVGEVMPGAGILAVSILCALGVGVLASLLLSRYLTRPLEKMDKTAQRLAAGDYAARTGVEMTDDIGRLAHTLDMLSQRLAQVDEERARLNQMRQDFIVDVSHELRTPVTVLRGTLESLRDGVVEQPEACVAQMLTEVIQIQRLVGDLLELSRLQNADFPLRMETVNLCDILDDSVRALRRAGEQADCPLEVSLPDETAIWVHGDYGRLRQMIRIVVDNGIKYSLPGYPVRIRLGEEQPGVWVLDVTNRSHGVPQEELEHLFQRFWRRGDDRNPEGTGLGLSIARQIAQRHGVEMAVRSEPEAETVFSYRFQSVSWDGEA